jgi:hypothetical protein
MDQVKKTTRTLLGGTNSTEPVRRIQPPCRRSDGNKVVTIKLFDKHQFVNDMATPEEVRTDLETFLNGLATTSGLEAAVAAQLSAITFRVTYQTTSPGQAEIDQLNVNDFPIYFLTRTGVFQASTDDVLDLLGRHRIPDRTFVGRRQGALPEPVLAPVDPRGIINEDWSDKPSVLGFGIPGTYFIPNSQTRCRKIGIIKMQGFMTENLPVDRRRAKIAGILKHELGHMFGLVHEDGTIMAKDYNLNASHTDYTINQLWVMDRAFALLMPP